MFSRFAIAHQLLALMFVLSIPKSTYYKDGVISCKRWTYHQSLLCEQLHWWLVIINRSTLMSLLVITSWTLIFHISSIVPNTWRLHAFLSLEEFKVTFTWMSISGSYSWHGTLSIYLGIQTQTKDTTFSSKAYGTRESKQVNLEGRLQLDLLQAIQRDYKLRSYTLNAVSAEFLGTWLLLLLDSA